MQTLGNNALLALHKTAFLASSTIPVGEVLRCLDWARQVSRGEGCIVSGFSSHLERQVFSILQSGTCPIIIALARTMYRQLPVEWQPLVDNGRLLVISTTNAPRQSRATAALRNRWVCQLADEIAIVANREGSGLAALRDEYRQKVLPMFLG